MSSYGDFVLQMAQSTSPADQSITKTLFSPSSVGVCGWGKELWTVSPQKEPQEQSAQLLREAVFLPALNHSPVSPTELLSIHQAPPHPRQAQQKAF